MGRTSSSLLEGAEEPLDVGEVLVAGHHVIGGQAVGGQAGAQHPVDAVEGGFGGDVLGVAGDVKDRR